MNDFSGLCLTYFNPKKVTRWICCDCNSMVGKSHASLRFIDKGSVTFSLFGKTVVASEGDVLFIPNGACYYAVWKGSPEVVFYSIDFNFAKASGECFDNRFSLSLIDAHKDKIKKVILSAYEKCQNSSPENDKLSAVSEFYSILAEITPYLTLSTENEIPKSVRLAIEYIEKNYKTDFTGKEIAKACFISESRLYHLFSEVMKCSPVTYKNRLKINDAIAMLTQTDIPIEKIAVDMGFNSSAYFRKVFKSMTGANPLEYRRKGFDVKADN